MLQHSTLHVPLCNGGVGGGGGAEIRHLISRFVFLHTICVCNTFRIICTLILWYWYFFFIFCTYSWFQHLQYGSAVVGPAASQQQGHRVTSWPSCPFACFVHVRFSPGFPVSSYRSKTCMLGYTFSLGASESMNVFIINLRHHVSLWWWTWDWSTFPTMLADNRHQHWSEPKKKKEKKLVWTDRWMNHCNLHECTWSPMDFCFCFFYFPPPPTVYSHQSLYTHLSSCSTFMI